MKMGRLDFRHKLIAIFLSISLAVYETFSYAAPLVPAPEPPQIPAASGVSFKSALSVPENLGRIEEENITGSEMSVILIQDAHGQTSAQENTEKLLTHLDRALGVDAVFLEGGLRGRISPDLLRFSKSPKLNKAIAGDLLKRGVIAGPDYFLLERPDIPGFGAESGSHYGQDVLVFRKIYSKRKGINAFLEGLKGELIKSSAEIFNPDLKAFVREWLLFQDSRRDWITHMDFLDQKAQKFLNLDFHDPRNQTKYPQLVRFFKIRELEQEFASEDFSRELSREKEAWAAWVEAQKITLPEVLEVKAWVTGEAGRKTPAPKELRRLLESFSQEARGGGFEWQLFPRLSRFFAHEVLSQELESADLFSEIAAVTDALIAGLVRTPEEKVLMKIFENYRLLKKLFELEWTRGEYAKMKDSLALIRPSAMLEQLRTLGPREGKRRSVAAADAVFEEALFFYDLALKREEIMVDSMLASMSQAGFRRAVLVAGGFHADGIAEMLKQRKISCTVVMPHMSSLEPPTQYLSQMTLGAWKDSEKSTVSAPNPARISVPVMRYVVSPADQKFLEAQLLSAIGAAAGKNNFERGTGYGVQFPDKKAAAGKSTAGRRSEMRRSPWESGMSGYSMARLMTLIEYLPRAKISAEEYERLGAEGDFQGLLNLINLRERKPVAPNLNAVPGKPIETLARNQAPPSQAIHELVKNGSDWSVSNNGGPSVRSSRHGAGGKQLLGQLGGEGEYAVIETKTETGRGVRVTLWNIGTEEYPDYQFHYEFADGLPRGTKISVVKPLTPDGRSELESLLREKLKFNSAGPVIMNGQRINTPEAFEYSGPEKGNKIREDLSRVEVTVTPDGYEVQDFGTGMNMKVLLEGFFNLNNSGAGEQAAPRKRTPALTKVFTKPALSRTARVEIGINGHLIQSQVFSGERLNVVENLAVDLPPGTPAPHSWDVVEFDAKSVECVKDVIRRVTSPSSDDPLQFAAINTLALLIRSISGNPGAVKTLIEALKVRTQALIQARRAGGQKIIPVPNLAREAGTPRGWSGFDSPEFLPLDPDLFDFNFEALRASGLLLVPDFSLRGKAEELAPELKGVSLYVVDWKFREKTGMAADWILVKGRPVILIDKEVYLKAVNGNPFLLLKLLAQIAKKLPQASAQPEKPEVKEKKSSPLISILMFFRKFYGRILLAFAAFGLALTLWLMWPSSVTPPESDNGKAAATLKDSGKSVANEKVDKKEEVKDDGVTPRIDRKAQDEMIKLVDQVAAENQKVIESLKKKGAVLREKELRLDTDFINPYSENKKTKMTVAEADKLNTEIQKMRREWVEEYKKEGDRLKRPEHRAPVATRRTLEGFLDLGKDFNSSQRNTMEYSFFEDPREKAKWIIEVVGDLGTRSRVDASIDSYVYKYPDVRDMILEMKNIDSRVRINFVTDIGGPAQKMSREEARKNVLRAIYLQAEIDKFISSEENRLGLLLLTADEPQKQEFEKLKVEAGSRPDRVYYYSDTDEFRMTPRESKAQEQKKAEAPDPVSVLRGKMDNIVARQNRLNDDIKGRALAPGDILIMREQIERMKLEWKQDFEAEVAKNDPAQRARLRRLAADFNDDMSKARNRDEKGQVRDDPAGKVEIPPELEDTSTTLPVIGLIPVWVLKALFVVALILGIPMILRFLLWIVTGAPGPRRDRVGSHSPFEKTGRERSGPIQERGAGADGRSEEDVYGSVKNSPTTSLGSGQGLITGYYFPLKVNGDWSEIPEVSKKAKPGSKPVKKDIEVTFSGDAAAGQKIPLLNYSNGVIRKIEIMRDAGGGKMEPVPESDWVLSGEKVVFSKPGNYSIKCTVDIYKEEDIRWNFSVDPLARGTKLLPPNEIEALKTYFSLIFKDALSMTDDDKIRAVEKWMKEHLYYNRTSDTSRELDRSSSRNSWTSDLHLMTKDGEKCGVICNTSSLVKILLLGHLDVPTVYMTMVFPESDGRLTTARDGHAAPLIYVKDLDHSLTMVGASGEEDEGNLPVKSAVWKYSESTDDLGSAPLNLKALWGRMPNLNPLRILGGGLVFLYGGFMRLVRWAGGITLRRSLQTGKLIYHLSAIALVFSSVVLGGLMLLGVTWASTALMAAAGFFVMAAVWVSVAAVFFARSKGFPVFSTLASQLDIPVYGLFRQRFNLSRHEKRVEELSRRLELDDSGKQTLETIVHSLYRKNNGNREGWAKTFSELDPDPESPRLEFRFLDDPAFLENIDQWKDLYKEYLTNDPSGDDVVKFLILIAAAQDRDGNSFLFTFTRSVDEKWVDGKNVYAGEWMASNVFLRSPLAVLRSEMRPVLLELGDRLLRKALQDDKVPEAVRILKFANRLLGLELKARRDKALRFLQLAELDPELAVKLMDYLEEGDFAAYVRTVPRIQTSPEAPPLEMDGDAFALQAYLRIPNRHAMIWFQKEADGSWTVETVVYKTEGEGTEDRGEEIMRGKVTVPAGVSAFQLSLGKLAAGFLNITFPAKAGESVKISHVIDPEAPERIRVSEEYKVEELRMKMLGRFEKGDPGVLSAFSGRMGIWAEWVLFGGSIDFEKGEQVEGVAQTGSLLDDELTGRFSDGFSLAWLIDAAKRNMGEYDAGRLEDLSLEQARKFILEAANGNDKPLSEREMLASISAQDRTRMLMIRELIQNARDAILNLPAAEREGMEIRVRSYLVREGEQVRWVVSIRDPVGMKHSVYFFKFWAPRVSTKSRKEALKEILRNAPAGPDSQAVEVITQMMDDEAQTDLAIRAWISERIQANGDIDRTVVDILRQFGRRFRKTRAAGMFGIGKDTVYADADEVVARTGAGEKVYNARIRVGHQDTEDPEKVTDLSPLEYAEYSDPENVYKGTSIQRVKDVKDIVQAGFMDKEMKYLFVEFVGAVDDVPIVFEDQNGKPLNVPVRDKITKLASYGKDSQVSVVRSGLGIVRLTVDKLLVQSKRDPRVYKFIPDWAQKWMDDSAVGLDFIRGTPVTESRTSLLKPASHAGSAGAAVLNALTLAYRSGQAVIPGISSYGEFLKSASFDPIDADEALMKDAEKFSRGEELTDAAWQGYMENPERYRLLFLHLKNASAESGPVVSLAEEKIQLFFRMLPEWVRREFFQNESFRKEVKSLGNRLTADPVKTPDIFSKQAAAVLLLALARLYVAGKVLIPGLPRFQEYLNPDHAMIEGSMEVALEAGRLASGDFAALDFASYQGDKLLHILLALPLEKGKSINAIKKEVLDNAAAARMLQEKETDRGARLAASRTETQAAMVRLTNRLEIKTSEEPVIKAFELFLDGFFNLLDSNLGPEEKRLFNYARIDWNFSENNWELARLFGRFLSGDAAAEQELLVKLLDRTQTDPENSGIAYYNALLNGNFDASALIQPGVDATGLSERFADRLAGGGALYYEYQRGAIRSEMRSFSPETLDVPLDVQVEVAVYAAQRMVRPEVLGALDLELEEKLWGARKAARAEGDPAVTKLANAIMQSTRPVSAVSVVPDDLSAEEMEQYVTGILPVLNQPVSTHEVVVLVQGENTAEFKKLFEKAFNAAARKFQVTEPRQKLLQVHIVGERKFETTGDIFLQGREVLVIAPYGFKSRLLDERGALSRVMSDRLINQSPITQKNRRNLLGTFVATGFETLLFQPKEMEQDEYMAMGPGQAWYLRNESLIGDLNAFVTGLMEQTRWVAQSA